MLRFEEQNQAHAEKIAEYQKVYPYGIVVSFKFLTACWPLY